MKLTPPERFITNADTVSFFLHLRMQVASHCGLNHHRTVTDTDSQWLGLLIPQAVTPAVQAFFKEGE